MRWTRWNSSHANLTVLLRTRPKLHGYLSSFYAVGSVAGLLGMLGALMALAYTSVELARAHLRPAYHHKREVVVRPIIPGVTVPLTHLPLILAAVIVNQLFHELGHFVAAALAQTPLHSLTFSLFIILPTFSTVLSGPALAALSPSARIRIITAGPWHNLILYALVALLGIALAQPDRPGRLVVNVDQVSALHAYLPPGTVIAALDDTPLAPSNATHDVWTTYLTSDASSTAGWCVQRSWYLEHDDACCTTPSERTCFVSLSAERRCLDPVPILTRRTPRCTTLSQCPDASVCIAPRDPRALLRLTIRKDGDEDIILWSGPRDEVWAHVTVVPRSSEHTWWTYIRAASLSLFFFNLLPLPHLDGAQLLRALLSHSSHAQSEQIDLEGGGRMRREPRTDVRTGVAKAVEGVTSGLCVLCAILGAWRLFHPS